MTGSSIPSPKLLRQLLEYDPKTGAFTWRERSPALFANTGLGGSAGEASRWNAARAGRPADNQTYRGYRRIAINRKYYAAHRLAWAIFYGEWPKGQIDHINHVKSDNRIANLRDVTCLENQRNIPKLKVNTSGRTGVRFNVRLQKWTATIGDRGRLIHLGVFSDFNVAVVAREAAEAALDYHPNHGREAIR